MILRDEAAQDDESRGKKAEQQACSKGPMLKKLATAALFVTSLPVLAAGRGTVTTLDKVVKEVSARQKTVKTLQADFRQEKELALLTKPEVSNGSFLYSKPNNVVWKYEAPRPVIMNISNGWMTTYYPQLNKAEKLDVRRYQDRIFRYMAASGALDELGNYFDFTFVESKSSPFYTLDLTPKNKIVGKRVKRIKIWIDRKSYLTTKFEYVEPDGDLTRYEFSNIRVNEQIAPQAFELNLPPTVRVEQMKLQ
jgi:outer membrane lipoprotein carrier protein